jgi:hypothetical protein
MRRARGRPHVLILVIGLAVGILVGTSVMMAQGCAMCSTSVANSTQAAQATRTLRSAILMLLIPTVTLFLAIFFIAFRMRNSFRSFAASDSVILTEARGSSDRTSFENDAVAEEIEPGMSGMFPTATPSSHLENRSLPFDPSVVKRSDDAQRRVA